MCELSLIHISGVPVVVPSSAPEGAGMPRLAVEELTWGYPVEWRRGPVFNTRIETALAPGRTMWSASFERGQMCIRDRPWASWSRSSSWDPWARW